MGEFLDRLCAKVLGKRCGEGLLRQRRIVRHLDATHLEFEGRTYVNFASNDYLGLTHHPRMIGAVQKAAEKFGVGSGAAGLISGYTEEHAAAEREIAQWKKMQSAMLMPSGYQANLAAVQTLAGVGIQGLKGWRLGKEFTEGGLKIEDMGGRAEDGPAQRRTGTIRFLVDQLAHASLIDAVRGSGAEWRVFPHNHLGKLARLLREGPAGQMQVVVTESIFSMDGDAADLRGLAELKDRFGFVLMLDEAHGTGVYGECGRGYAAECGCAEVVDISILTLSKAMGCVGGAICGSKEFIDAAVNFGRAGIYSTNAPPAAAAAARAAIGVMRDEPGRQKRLREWAGKIRAALRVPGVADSPIVPVILGSEEAALGAAERLREAGMWVVAVRPPTVKRGSSRLRITVSSEHTEGEIDALIQKLKLTTDGHR